MKALRIILLALAFISLQAHAKDGRNLGVKESASVANRFALVIGNNDYKHVEPLEKAVNDARAMGNALEQAQFTTKVIVNASRAQMNMAINRFVADVAGGGIGVFFFAGHGVQVNNQNFLIPVDLQDIQSEADIADQGVSLQGVQDKLAEARAKFSLLVIDACRNNPLPKRAGRALGGLRGMAQASSAEGQMVVFSAGANQQALDKLSNSDTDPNGVFTREFLPWLTKPGVTIRDAVLQVRSSVRARAKSVNHDQFPAIYDQAEGNFYFVEGSPQVASLEPVPAPVPAPARIKSRDEIEQETWESARDSGNIGAIQEYLKQYPKGRFAGQAKVLIATLKAEPAKPAEPIAQPAREDNETALWTEAQKGNTREDYQAYLAKYPKGKYDSLAKARLKKLDDEAAQQEQSAWDSANGTATGASYQGYLNNYPQGRYAILATARIAKLNKEAAQAALAARPPANQVNNLDKMSAPSGKMTLFATRPGSVAADGSGNHGLYTENLLSAMDVPNLPIEEFVKHVVAGVKKGSNGRQEPWMEGSIAGDFYFRGGSVSEQRIALVIGNSDYKSAPLKNPLNDARAMSAKLKELGFDVIAYENLQQKQLDQVLKEFRSRLKPGAVALFFYAGHGLQVKDVDYLPMVDADIKSEADVPLASLDVNKVFDVMAEAKTRLNLVFLDTSRYNPYAREPYAKERVNNTVREQKVALVIGNSAYTNSPLKNPVNDAKDIANKLRGLGFDVIERNNLQAKQIGSTLREFRSKLVPGAVALVFYAGHGLQINGENYLPAVDADINAEEDVQNQSLSVKQIMDVLYKAKTRLNLVFLDACRNNPYARSSSAEKGLAKVDAPSSTLVSFATRPGSVAPDGDGVNGLYTSNLLSAMDVPNLPIEKLVRRVVIGVRKGSNGRQEPWMEGSIEGDFYFRGGAQ